MEPLAPPRDDDEAWRELRARWHDEDAHRAFLARRPGLDGLAEAGRRYREALAAQPGDPVALRWRDEVLRRAAAQALAQLPRTRAPARSRVRGLLLAALAAAVVAAIGFAAALLRGTP